jgi:hypothetical protein
MRTSTNHTHLDPYGAHPTQLVLLASVSVVAIRMGIERERESKLMFESGLHLLDLTNRTKDLLSTLLPPGVLAKASLASTLDPSTVEVEEVFDDVLIAFCCLPPVSNFF